MIIILVTSFIFTHKPTACFHDVEGKKKDQQNSFPVILAAEKQC